jgi:hypothetical protein
LTAEEINALDSVERKGFPSLGTILDRAGFQVDGSGPVWRLNNVGAKRDLDWSKFPLKSESILHACASYIANVIKSFSPSEVFQNFWALLLLFKHSPSFGEADSKDEIIPYKAISEAREALGDSQWRVQYLRKWYIWCVDQGFENFSPEVAFSLREISFGHNPRATAVLSADPEQGPLVDTEIVSLLNALRAAELTEALTLTERAALWLCVALGCNPLQFVLLMEEDLQRIVAPGSGDVFYQLSVPRMKKRHARQRTELKKRKLTAEIGLILEALIAENHRRWDEEGWPTEGRARPLFVRDTLRTDLVGGPMDEYAHCLESSQFTALVAQAVGQLEVISPRGEPARCKLPPLPIASSASRLFPIPCGPVSTMARTESRSTSRCSPDNASSRPVKEDRPTSGPYFNEP